jgi:hypothetical protein
MSRSRSYRRAQSEKAENHVRDIVYNQWPDKNLLSDKKKDKIVKHMRDNPKQCSCSMCRNPRTNKWNKRKEKLTMQERKMEESIKKERLNENY